MINILPTEEKEQITYARRNTRLAKWSLALLLAIFGLFIVIMAGQFYLNQNTNSILRQVEAAQKELEVQKLDETKSRVTEISNSLKLVVQVLSREVLFSKLIKQIGAVTPDGVALTSLSIVKLQGGIDLEFDARDYQTASQVQINLSDPENVIFEKVDIIDINCGLGAGTSDPDYHCTIRIRALFNKENQFLFINNKPKGTTP